MHNARALAALFGRLGREEQPQALYEECGGKVTIDAAASALAARGFEARVVRATGRELVLLPRPTLVTLEGGDVVVLTEVRGREAVLDGGNGVPVRVPLGATVLAGQAIDRSFSAATSPSSDQCTSLRAFLAQLWRRERPVRRTVALYLCLSGLLSLLGFASPLLIALGMDAASMGDVPNTLRFVVVAAVLLGAHRSHFYWMRQSAVRFLEARASTTIRTALVGRIVRAPLVQAERLAGGAGWRILTLADRIVSGGIELVTTLVFAVLGLGYLLVVFIKLPLAAAALTLVAGALVLVNGLIAPRIVAAKHAAEGAAERQRAELLDLVRGAPASQVAGAQRNGVRRWLRLLVEEGEKNLWRDWADRRLQIATQTVEQLAVVGLVIWCGAQALDGALSRGTALACVQGGTMFLLACTSLAQAMLAGAELRADAARLEEVLRLDPLPAVQSLPRPRLAPGKPLIELRDVYFRYASDKPWVLQHYSLRIEAGQKVVLRWPSGGGKTTLLRIIAGLVRPTHGTATVAGVDPAYARALVTYLTQTTYLFAGSILDNLTVLSGGQPREALIAAARKTGLHDILDRWPMGFETVVGWGGGNLSGGERQLVALTAAVASDRPIVLLDEAMANIDRLTQGRLAQSGLFEGKTVIRVVHEEAMLEAARSEEALPGAAGDPAAAVAAG